MKKSMAALKKFLSNIWFYFRNRKINKFNKKLENAVKDQEKERCSFLEKDFGVFLRSYFKSDASGKFIPLKGKNKAEVYEAVMAKYSEDLSRLNITFTKSLQIKL